MAGDDIVVLQSDGAMQSNLARAIASIPDMVQEIERFLNLHKSDQACIRDALAEVNRLRDFLSQVSEAEVEMAFTELLNRITVSGISGLVHLSRTDVRAALETARKAKP